MPYRIVVPAASTVVNRLVDLGALDLDHAPDGAVAAVMPDGIAPAEIARVLGVGEVNVSRAIGRDSGSVWVLRPRSIRIGRLEISPAEDESGPDSVRLIDAAVFGTGLHPTTTLCLEAIDDVVHIVRPDRILDVGTGSGVLALAGLKLGVPRALAIDTDDEAVRVAIENARINGVSDRLDVRRGGPASIAGTWPLVVANILAAVLIESAPSLTRHVAHQGRLVLSGIPASVEGDVLRTYCRLGMRHVSTTSRGDWVALQLETTW